MKTKKNILEKIIKNRLEETHLDFSMGSGCFKIKKLTDKYVIFKGCYDNTSTKYFFDFTDFDDQIMYYLLKKNRRSHFYIKQTLNIRVKKIKEKRLTKKMVMDFLDVFGRAHLSDIAEYYNQSPLKVMKIFKELEEEKKLRESQ